VLAVSEDERWKETQMTKETDSRVLSNAELDQVCGGKITTTTMTVKVPGPTDLVVTTAENPGGGTPVGHQSVETVPNRLA
jgi:hypothetical protein